MLQGDKHSAHMINERTQGESHPHSTNNTLDDHNISHIHCQEGRTTDEHLDALLIQVNLYTNDDVILYRVFPTSLKGVTLMWYGWLPPQSIVNFDTLVECFSSQYATS